MKKIMIAGLVFFCFLGLAGMASASSSLGIINIEGGTGHYEHTRNVGDMSDEVVIDSTNTFDYHSYYTNSVPHIVNTYIIKSGTTINEDATSLADTGNDDGVVTGGRLTSTVFKGNIVDYSDIEVKGFNYELDVDTNSGYHSNKKVEYTDTWEYYASGCGGSRTKPVGTYDISTFGVQNSAGNRVVEGQLGFQKRYNQYRPGGNVHMEQNFDKSSAVTSSDITQRMYASGDFSGTQIWNNPSWNDWVNMYEHGNSNSRLVGNFDVGEKTADWTTPRGPHTQMQFHFTHNTGLVADGNTMGTPWTYNTKDTGTVTHKGFSGSIPQWDAHIEN